MCTTKRREGEGKEAGGGGEGESVCAVVMVIMMIHRTRVIVLEYTLRSIRENEYPREHAMRSSS
jgi:hypothetical protein